MTRALILFSLVLAFIGSVVFIACQTDAETPNAYFAHDGGPGDVGQLCRSSNTCNDTELVCIDEDKDGPLPASCRTKCLTTDADPCGTGFKCIGIEGQGSNGGCLPAPGNGEACTGRCDDGFVCTGDVDGGAGLCEPTGGGEGEGEGEGE